MSQKCTNDGYTKYIIVKKLEINNIEIIGEKFNEYFVNVELNLLSEVLKSYTGLKPIISKMTKTLNETNMTGT